MTTNYTKYEHFLFAIDFIDIKIVIEVDVLRKDFEVKNHWVFLFVFMQCL